MTSPHFSNLPSLQLNLHWLTYFAVVAECQSFRQAADQIGLTPPALSKALSELERYLGHKLIERSNKFEGLTVAGQLLLERTQPILQMIAQMEQEVHQLNQQSSQGLLRIGYESCFQACLLPTVMLNLLRKHPQIYPQLSSLESNQVLDGLQQGTIDIGLLSMPPAQDKQIQVLKLAQIPYQIVHAVPEPRDWQTLSYIVPRNYQTGETLDRWDNQRFARQVIVETDSVQSAIALCLEGVGAAFLPQISILPMLTNKLLHQVATPPVEVGVDVFVVWENTLLSDVVQPIIYALQNEFACIQQTLGVQN